MGSKDGAADSIAKDRSYRAVVNLASRYAAQIKKDVPQGERIEFVLPSTGKRVVIKTESGMFDSYRVLRYDGRSMSGSPLVWRKGAFVRRAAEFVTHINEVRAGVARELGILEQQLSEDAGLSAAKKLAGKMDGHGLSD